jgi:hypothetical protein
LLRLQLSDGLHFLHTEAGVVHKAVCPENILITQSGAGRDASQLAGWCCCRCQGRRAGMHGWWRGQVGHEGRLWREGGC